MTNKQSKNQIFNNTQLYLKQYINGQNANEFKILVTDETTNIFIQQLFPSDQLIKLNICLVMQLQNLAQNQQTLEAVLSQDLAKVIVCIHSRSFDKVLQIINNNYSYIENFKILFVDNEILCKLNDKNQIVNLKTQILQNQNQNQKFKVFQADINIQFLNHKIFCSSDVGSLINYVNFYIQQLIQQSPTKYDDYIQNQNPILFNNVYLVNKSPKDDFTQFNSYLTQLQQVQEQSVNDSKFNMMQYSFNLFLIKKKHFNENQLVFTFNYFQMICKFKNVLNVLIHLNQLQIQKLQQDTAIDTLLHNIDELMECDQQQQLTDKVVQILKHLDIDIKLNHANISPQLLDSIILQQNLKTTIIEQIEQTTQQIQSIKSQEKHILTENDVSKINQFNQNKEFQNTQLLMQKFLMKFIKSINYQVLVQLCQETLHQQTTQQKFIEICQQNDFKHKFVKQQLFSLFKCSFQDSANNLQQLQQILNVNPLSSELQQEVEFAFDQLNYKNTSQTDQQHTLTKLFTFVKNQVEQQITTANAKQSNLANLIYNEKNFQTQQKQFNAQITTALVKKTEQNLNAQIQKILIFDGDCSEFDFSEFADNSVLCVGFVRQ